MKQISAKSKIIVAIIILIIVIGAAVVGTQGFNFDLRNQSSQMVEFKIGKEFEVSDINQITNEVFENQQVLIQKVEIYEDSVAITAKNRFGKTDITSATTIAPISVATTSGISTS